MGGQVGGGGDGWRFAYPSYVCYCALPPAKPNGLRESLTFRLIYVLVLFMNCGASPSLSETGDAGAGELCDEEAERTGRHLGMLAELAEIGMRLAREVERRAPTNSSHSGIFRHRWTVSKGPKSSVRHSADSDQLGSKSVLSGRE